jgi:hypothetical protein
MVNYPSFMPRQSFGKILVIIILYLAPVHSIKGMLNCNLHSLDLVCNIAFPVR